LLRSNSFRSSKGRSHNHYNCDGFLLYHLVVLYSDLVVVVGILREIIIVVEIGNGRSRRNSSSSDGDVLIERGFFFTN
jgi:hypothetical protein